MTGPEPVLTQDRAPRVGPAGGKVSLAIPESRPFRSRDIEFQIQALTQPAPLPVSLGELPNLAEAV